MNERRVALGGPELGAHPAPAVRDLHEKRAEFPACRIVSATNYSRVTVHSEVCVGVHDDSREVRGWEAGRVGVCRGRDDGELTDMTVARCLAGWLAAAGEALPLTKCIEDRGGQPIPRRGKAGTGRQAPSAMLSAPDSITAPCA